MNSKKPSIYKKLPTIGLFGALGFAALTTIYALVNAILRAAWFSVIVNLIFLVGIVALFLWFWSRRSKLGKEVPLSEETGDLLGEDRDLERMEKRKENRIDRMDFK